MIKLSARVSKLAVQKIPCGTIKLEINFHILRILLLFDEKSIEMYAINEVNSNPSLWYLKKCNKTCNFL